ncbi:hypothetical protein DCC81_00430 [Chitinophaga parva]|uniref:Glycosyltransferase 61 catalytic domain-containing protein n=1 Tax=Chitinophaga parva TaxID=2169414 RepID=A0A2T7BK22_9BACT|nr:glycosyltransferase family 61 protein [Chitinophaga parva]PUZ27989.1 hypothetical protein DCC81_00430 [Chitinophaga parva]
MNQPDILEPGITREAARPQNLKAEDLPLFQRYLSVTTPPVLLKRLRHAHILKDLVFTFRPFHFYTEYRPLGRPKRSTLLKRLLRVFYPVRRLERAIWITDEWTQEYYHWYVDGLSRLEAAATAVGKEVPVLLPYYYEQVPYVVESLRLLGYKAVYYGRKEHVVVKELLMPGYPAYWHLPPPALFKGLHEQLALPAAPPPHRKVYISRARARVRRILNEDAVQALMQQHGFGVHYMEDYTLAQQIALMAETRVLAGLHGAGFTNMLFMQTGTQVLELRLAGEKEFNCFFNMASDLGIRYYYTTNHGDNNSGYNANITADLAALEAALQAMGA